MFQISLKGNPQLQIRIPENHWIWKIENAEQRSGKVKLALSFYHEFANVINDIQEAISEIQKEQKEIREQLQLLTERMIGF